MDEHPRAVLLIVEPDVELGQAMCEILGSAGYGCRIAQNAKTAREVLEKEASTIDIVAVDVARHIPGTTELLDTLANFRGGVFVLSGNRADENIAASRGLPFLPMPFDLDDFVEHLERQLEEPTRPGRLPFAR